MSLSGTMTTHYSNANMHNCLNRHQDTKVPFSHSKLNEEWISLLHCYIKFLVLHNPNLPLQFLVKKKIIINTAWAFPTRLV